MGLRIAEPGRIGPLRLKNRLIMAPMGTNFGTSDGLSTERDRQYYVERAKGVRDALVEAHDMKDGKMKDGAARRVDVPDERIFGGLDGYQKVLAMKEVDLVILATCPGFRPMHITASVAARKHVFAEKPVCVDVAGYHACCAAHDKAQAQGTSIVTGP